MCKKCVSKLLKPMGVFSQTSNSGLRTEISEKLCLVKLEMSNYHNLKETGLRM